MSKIIKISLVIFACLIHLSFYFSSIYPQYLKKIFIPVTQGQDFFQIPNGAKDFLNGGKLTGQNHSFIDCCGVNNNVYHPLFTLLVGIPLQFFKPWTAFYLWLFFHFVTDVFIVLFLIKKFKQHPLLIPVLIFFLVNSLSYYEILNNQYHFLFNLFTFLLLYEYYKNKDTLKGGIFYFLGLMVKPIGLLWAIPLLFYKQYKSVLVGLGLYIIFSLPFYYLPEGKYFFDNFLGTAKSIVPNYNLIQILRIAGINLSSVYFLELIFIVPLVYLLILKKIKNFKIIFTMICFQLFFYGGTYSYHYSIIPLLVSLGILTKSIPLGLWQACLLLLLSLPAPLFISSYLKAENIGAARAVVFSLWFILPLSLLLVTMYFQIIKRGLSNEN